MCAWGHHGHRLSQRDDHARRDRARPSSIWTRTTIDPTPIPGARLPASIGLLQPVGGPVLREAISDFSSPSGKVQTFVGLASRRLASVMGHTPTEPSFTRCRTARELHGYALRVTSSPAARPSISVLTITYNGARYLPTLMASLARQDADFPWEYVVVDNGSTDGTWDVVSELARTLPAPVRMIDGGAKPGNIPYVRNLAAASARADHLVYCDQDDIVEPGWLAAAEDGLRQHEALMGLIHDMTPVDAPPRVMNPSVYTDMPIVESCNFAVRRATLEAAGGFDEDLAGYGMDDSELALRLRKKGHAIVGWPSMRIQARQTVGTMNRIRKVFSSARTEMVVWQKHADVYGDRRNRRYLCKETRTNLRTGWLAVRGSSGVSKDRGARAVVTSAGHLYERVRPRAARSSVVEPPCQPKTSESFDHIVITQFSAVFAPDAEPASQEWCWYRLAIFRKLLCPSMRSQSGAAPFTWLVYFDERCSSGFRAAVDELAAGLFVPIWTHDVYWDRVVRDVEKLSTREYLITTRVDSDDALSRGFIRSVQEEFARQDLLFVTFPRGLQLDDKGRMYSYDEPSGPFMSLIERRGSEPPRVVLSHAHFNHGLVRRYGPIREVITGGRPMWLQYIHGTNVANAVRGVRVPAATLSRWFDVEMHARPDASWLIFATDLVRSHAARVRFWGGTPYYAVEYVDALFDRIRGTHVKKPAGASVHGPPLLSALVRSRKGVSMLVRRGGS